MQVDQMQMGPGGKEDFTEKVASEADREGQAGWGVSGRGQTV